MAAKRRLRLLRAVMGEAKNDAYKAVVPEIVEALDAIAKGEIQLCEGKY
jgi:hypothetical protein